MIFVTNRNKFDHFDAYNGTEYHFPPGETVEVDDEAAAHMLGYGRKDKTENLIRLGWANKLDAKKGWVKDEEGVRKLANFTFEAGAFVKVPLRDDVVATPA